MFKNKLIVLLLIVVVISFSLCTNATQNRNSIKEITSYEEFNQVIEKEKDKLLGFDLYADWCRPCKILSPMLEKIADRNKDKITFYKINVDKFPKLASAFGVRGIPYVVFMKNKKNVYALTGVQSEDTYEKIIERYANTEKAIKPDKPSGEIVKGIRVIKLNKALSTITIHVYKGETVKLIFEPREYQYSVHIPEYRISKHASKNKKIKITFKAKNTGVFPIYCNGNCPSGDGAQAGKIVVMQYKSGESTEFIVISAKRAKELINKLNPLILDVRTPKEYYDGHIPNSKLIPLQQLEDRISEIGKYKDKEIIVYCRSGNRSVVAVEILIKNGFKKLYHIKNGILEWINEGFKIKK